VAAADMEHAQVPISASVMKDGSDRIAALLFAKRIATEEESVLHLRLASVRMDGLAAAAT